MTEQWSILCVQHKLDLKIRPSGQSCDLGFRLIAINHPTASWLQSWLGSSCLSQANGLHQRCAEYHAVGVAVLELLECRMCRLCIGEDCLALPRLQAMMSKAKSKNLTFGHMGEITCVESGRTVD